MSNSSLTAVGYARTSGDINPEASIPTQIEIIRKYCEQNNILLKQVLVDEKKSGMSTDKRFEYQKLKEIILQGSVDVVVVAFSDRLTRESFEFALTMEQMKRHGVDFISVKENLRGSRMSALEIAMVAIKNEMENNARAKRIKEGKLQSLRNGKYPFSKPPFGYTITKDKQLAIVEKEAELVKWIFDVYEEAKSIKEILAYVNSHHFQQDKRHKIIGKILEQPIYTGERDLPPNLKEQLPNVKIIAPPIISIEQFERVQKIREKKRRASASFYFLTQGVFVCPNCKGKLSLYTHKQSRVYYCKQGRDKKDPNCLRCDMEELDDKVLSFLNDWVDSREDGANKSDRGEELLRKKVDNELAFATAKISTKTYEANYQKIIQQYRQLDQENFIVPLSKLQTLKSSIKNGKSKDVKEYMVQNNLVVTLDTQGNVILVEE